MMLLLVLRFTCVKDFQIFYYKYFADHILLKSNEKVFYHIFIINCVFLPKFSYIHSKSKDNVLYEKVNEVNQLFYPKNFEIKKIFPFYNYDQNIFSNIISQLKIAKESQ